MDRLTTWTVAFLCAALFAGAAHADDPALEAELDTYLAASPSQPSFGIAIYAWVPASDGTIAAAGNSVPFDVSIGDAFDELEIGGLFRLDMWTGDWGLMIDVLYMKQSSTGPLALGTFTADFTMTMEEIIFYDRVSDSGGVSVDLLVGARFSQLENDVLLGAGPAVAGKADFIDPIIGTRLSYLASDSLLIVIRADAGGFGVGSELSWNISVVFSYALGKSIFISVGYRWYEADFTEGGAGTLFIADLQMHGPLVGITILF